MDHSTALTERFQTLFGERPEIVCFAPGRVNLIGEHTDYNGGHVFPCALSLGTWCAARRRAGDTVRFASRNIPRAGVTERPLGAPAEPGSRLWTRYPEGVIDAFLRDGQPLSGGLDLLYYGNIPSGSGLSSSASIEVVTGLALRELFGLDLTLPKLALLGQSAENVYVGVQCGIMDQFASAMGRRGSAIYLDTATLRYQYAPLRLRGYRLVVCNSKVKHSLASSEYNRRRQECEAALSELRRVRPELPSLGALSIEGFDALQDAIADPVCRKRAKHAVYENARTKQALDALRADRLDEFGRLMNESHVSLRDDYAVSCPELDLLTELAWSVDGVLGSRMTGGGFGGCTVSLLREEALPRFREVLREGYQKETGKTPDFYLARPGDGARVVHS